MDNVTVLLVVTFLLCIIVSTLCRTSKREYRDTATLSDEIGRIQNETTDLLNKRSALLDERAKDLKKREAVVRVAVNHLNELVEMIMRESGRK